MMGKTWNFTGTNALEAADVCSRYTIPDPVERHRLQKQLNRKSFFDMLKIQRMPYIKPQKQKNNVPIEDDDE